MHLGYWQGEQLPPELTAITVVAILISDQPATIRVPDVVVTRSELVAGNPARGAARNVLLAVEVSRTAPGASTAS